VGDSWQRRRCEHLVERHCDAGRTDAWLAVLHAAAVGTEAVEDGAGEPALEVDAHLPAGDADTGVHALDALGDGLSRAHCNLGQEPAVHLALDRRARDLRLRQRLDLGDHPLCHRVGCS